MAFSVFYWLDSTALLRLNMFSGLTVCNIYDFVVVKH